MNLPFAIITPSSIKPFSFSLPGNDSEKSVDVFVTEPITSAGEADGARMPLILYAFPNRQRLGVNRNGKIVLDPEVVIGLFPLSPDLCEYIF